jgi:hypothetical protein
MDNPLRYPVGVNRGPVSPNTKRDLNEINGLSQYLCQAILLLWLLLAANITITLQAMGLQFPNGATVAQNAKS